MRVFTPIDGGELAALIIHDHAVVLDQNAEFTRARTFPLVRYRTVTTIECLESEGNGFTVESEGAARIENTAEPLAVKVESGRAIAAPIDGQPPDVAREQAGLPVLEQKTTPFGLVDVQVSGQGENAFQRALARKRGR